MDVADLILEAVRHEVDRRLAEVLQVRFGKVETSSPLTVTLAGDSAASPVKPVDGFVATVGATVVLLKVGSKWWAVAERDI